MGQFLQELVARHIGHWIFAGGELADHWAPLKFAKLPSDRMALERLRDMADRRLSYMTGRARAESA